MDQDTTWYSGKPQPRPHCVVLDGDPALTMERGTAAPTFRPMSLLWPEGRLSQQLLSSCFFYMRKSGRVLTCMYCSSSGQTVGWIKM